MVSLKKVHSDDNHAYMVTKAVTLSKVSHCKSFVRVIEGTES